MRKITLMVICAVFCTTACDNYLDVKSNSGLVTPNTVESLQRLLDASQYMNCAVIAIAEASADDYFLMPATYNAISELDKLVYTWRKVDQIWPNDWADAYLAVYNANLALDQLEGIERTNENSLQWDNVKGSALFFRGHQFLTLVWTYAKAYNEASAQTDLGIVLRKTSDPSVPSERASLAATYQQIIADLEASIPLLPMQSEHPMRPSVVAVYGMLARTYLSMARFDSAYVYADRALDVRAELMDFNNPDFVNPTASTPFERFNKETLFYTELMNVQPNISRYYAMIDSLLYRSYDENDLRKQAYFTLNANGFASFKGSYSASTTLFAGLTTAELYLIRAESAARLGKREGALADLNTLLVNRWKSGTFMPVTAENDKETLDLILAERRKELLMRGLRWIDIKRLNLESADIVVKRKIDGNEIVLEPNDNRFALPIPVDVIRITGIPQNEY